MTVADTRPGHRLERLTHQTSRALDFCNEKGLISATGHQPEHWPLVVVKELIDNALDAAEEARTAPEIEVKVDDIGIAVTDNGPGIPADTVKAIIDYSIRVSSREAYVAPDRGAQGNALKTLIAMPFVLDKMHGTGQRGISEVISKGIHHRIGLAADYIHQRPDISHDVGKVYDKKDTEFRVHWPESARLLLDDAKGRFLQIVDDYTWLNPHLTVAVDWFGEKGDTTATDPAWPKWGPSDPTCAHWYRLEHLERLIAAHIVHDAASASPRTVREFISEFRGLRGSNKQKKISDAAGLHGERLSSLAIEGAFDSDATARLLAAMQEHSNPVPPKTLGIIGKEHLQRCFAASGVEMDSFRYKKVADIIDGIPRVVEVAFGWCPGAESRRLITGVNWSPAITNPFRQLGTFGRSLDTILSRERADHDDPVIILLHIARPRTEYTDQGKSNVVVEGGDAIIDVIQSVTKPWKTQRRAEERKSDAILNRKHAMSRSYRVSIKDAANECMEAAYLKASAGGTLPALARQIMYAARPHVQSIANKLGKDFDKRFTGKLLPEYMKAHPVETSDWDVVYDARGHFREPHTEEEVALGTLHVRSYLERVEQHQVDGLDFNILESRYPTLGPERRYGAILFIEKEGFMSLFERVKLEQRYDLAIMSTKGMSNTASRKLVDTLCSKHDIPLLVLHDFDKSGFSIFGTLKDDTPRYEFKNEIEAIDIGLRIDDINGLETEGVVLRGSPRKFRLNLRKNGATDEEIEFLMSKRVELNALTSDRLVTLIERRLAEHGVSKAIPSINDLASAYRREMEQASVQKKIDDMLDGVRKTSKEIAVPDNLSAQIEKYLNETPSMSWDQAMKNIALVDFNSEDNSK